MDKTASDFNARIMEAIVKRQSEIGTRKKLVYEETKEEFKIRAPSGVGPIE